jgi:proteasome accessory factor B
VASARRVVVTLDHTELVGLLVAAHLSRDAPYAGAAATAVTKLAGVLDAGERRAVDELRGRFRVAVPEPVQVRPRVRSVLEDAVHAQTVVRLQYVDRNGVASSRRVEPVGFYAADGRWALVAWCQWRDAGRLFYLHRVQRAHATSVRFTPREVDEVLGWVPAPGRRP